jgi:hypothetical protein
VAGARSWQDLRAAGAAFRGLISVAPEHSKEELVEVMVQLVPYVGVAAAINGVIACREVFAADDRKSKAREARMPAVVGRA